MTITDVEAGQVIVFTYGEYSDYCIAGVVIAEKPFNLKEVREAFNEANKVKKLYTYPNAGGKFYYEYPKISVFIANLTTTGLVKEVHAMEFNVDYPTGLAKIDYPEYH